MLGEDKKKDNRRRAEGETTPQPSVLHCLHENFLALRRAFVDDPAHHFSSYQCPLQSFPPTIWSLSPPHLPPCFTCIGSASALCIYNITPDPS